VVALILNYFIYLFIYLFIFIIIILDFPCKYKYFNSLLK